MGYSPWRHSNFEMTSHLGLSSSGDPISLAEAAPLVATAFFKTSGSSA
jgi:hypothetical protein